MVLHKFLTGRCSPVRVGLWDGVTPIVLRGGLGWILGEIYWWRTCSGAGPVGSPSLESNKRVDMALGDTGWWPWRGSVEGWTC